jgi:hypothetical protein
VLECSKHVISHTVTSGRRHNHDPPRICGTVFRLVKKGARWGIGDGTKTRILSDQWIPDVKPYMLRPLVPVPLDMTVDSLMLGDSRTWDVDTVCPIFDEAVVDQILQVPISRHGGDDYVAWPHSRFGQYIV